MPTRNKQVKRETRVAKVSEEAAGRQLNGLGVAVQEMSRVLPKPATPVAVSPDGVHTRVLGSSRLTASKTAKCRICVYVPVIASDGTPLMPTIPSRARRWIKTGEATPFWKKGVFCVRLNAEPSGREIQPIAVGIDPGSKKEGYSVKSEAHTYLNVQADAVTWVKDAVKTRREMRRGRRFRKTPCRANRRNRARGCLPPSTKARWQWKLRLATWLSRLYPIERFVVEDIKATNKGKRRWDLSFSPLQVGKEWFYSELAKIALVETKSGWETKELRDALGLKRIGNKTAEAFEAHCVDAWVLANSWIGGHVMPDNTQLLCITPLRFHRRQLHRLQPEVGGIRRPYGGTRSLGFKRGSLIEHPKWGLTYVGGCLNGRLSLHQLADGRRLCQNARPSEVKFLAFNSWRTRLLPCLKTGVSAA